MSLLGVAEKVVEKLYSSPEEIVRRYNKRLTARGDTNLVPDYYEHPITNFPIPNDIPPIPELAQIVGEHIWENKWRFLGLAALSLIKTPLTYTNPETGAKSNYSVDDVMLTILSGRAALSSRPIESALDWGAAVVDVPGLLVRETGMLVLAYTHIWDHEAKRPDARPSPASPLPTSDAGTSRVYGGDEDIGWTPGPEAGTYVEPDAPAPEPQPEPEPKPNPETPKSSKGSPWWAKFVGFVGGRYLESALKNDTNLKDYLEFLKSRTSPASE